MKLLKKILEQLRGLHYRQEYLCFAEEQFLKPLKMYLVHETKVQLEITQQHAFVGYHPVIFVFPSLQAWEWPETVEILFTDNTLKIGKECRSRDAIALISFKQIKIQEAGSEKLYYYQGIWGRHRFLSSLQQRIVQWHNMLYNQQPGNVFLKGNLYNQVQIAYSRPRKICLISVTMQGLYNLFPTDLHGKVTDEFYVISLRHAGKACEQVKAAGQIVLSDMQVEACQKVYRLGKNHMQLLKEASAFDFSTSVSKVFQLLLPNGIVGYKELALHDWFITGIHCLLLFKIVSNKSLSPVPNTLVQIHNSYATWRYKKGLPGNYLIR